MTKSSIKAVLVGTLLFSGLALGSASAETILTLRGSWTNVGGGDTQYDANESRGTFKCSVSCEGLVTDTPSQIFSSGGLPTLASGTETWSGTTADMFWLPNSSSAGEIQWIKDATNPAPDPTNFTGQLTGGNAGFQFTTNALYVLLKIGQNPQYALIKNTSGGSQTYTYGGNTGLSHFVLASNVPEIPLPEPGTLALLGLGLAGLAMMRRRKQ